MVHRRKKAKPRKRKRIVKRRRIPKRQFARRRLRNKIIAEERAGAKKYGSVRAYAAEMDRQFLASPEGRALLRIHGRI